MNVAFRVFVALAAGLVVGVVVAILDRQAFFAAVSAVEPIGKLWVNGIRMTVIPLVISLLISGIGSGSPSQVGRVGGRAAMWFVLLVAGTSLFAAVAAPPLLALAPLGADAFAALRDSADGSHVCGSCPVRHLCRVCAAWRELEAGSAAAPCEFGCRLALARARALGLADVPPPLAEDG